MVHGLTNAELMRLFVLDAMADDFSDLEQLVETAVAAARRSGVTAEREEVIAALMDLGASGWCNAYDLHRPCTSPFETQVPFPESIAAMERLSFFPTDKGTERLTRDWPFDGE